MADDIDFDADFAAYAPDPAVLGKAEILVEALPYLQTYSGAIFVVKFGGHAMVDPALARAFAEDVTLLKQVGIRPVVVHGGGPQIGGLLKRLGIKTEFVDGLRVTDAATAEVAEMVLVGSINKEIVTSINQAGGRAVGLSGKDGGFVTARKLTHRDRNGNGEVDLGFVGEPERIDPTIIELIAASDAIPVIAPIASGPNGETFNINADTMAGAVSVALGAKRLIMLTDVPGVLDREGRLLSDLTPSDIARLVEDGTIRGGMLPKLETCTVAVGAGVGAAAILDGRIPHAVLLEIFTSKGAGTLVRC